MAQRSYAPTTVAVAPTKTTLATIDVSKSSTVCIHVSNGDATQLLDCTVWRRPHPDVVFVESAVEGLVGIRPLSAQAVDVDCGADFELRVTGVASGAGLDAVVTVRDESGTGGGR